MARPSCNDLIGNNSNTSKLQQNRRDETRPEWQTFSKLVVPEQQIAALKVELNFAYALRSGLQLDHQANSSANIINNNNNKWVWDLLEPFPFARQLASLAVR